MTLLLNYTQCSIHYVCLVFGDTMMLMQSVYKWSALNYNHANPYGHLSIIERKTTSPPNSVYAKKKKKHDTKYSSCSTICCSFWKAYKLSFQRKKKQEFNTIRWWHFARSSIVALSTNMLSSLILDNPSWNKMIASLKVSHVPTSTIIHFQIRCSNRFYLRRSVLSCQCKAKREPTRDRAQVYRNSPRTPSPQATKTFRFLTGFELECLRNIRASRMFLDKRSAHQEVKQCFEASFRGASAERPPDYHGNSYWRDRADRNLPKVQERTPRHRSNWLRRVVWGPHWPFM